MNWTDKIVSNALKGTRPVKNKRDWDGDGVPNKKDCQPRNTMRQDEAKYQQALKILKSKNIPYYSDWSSPGRSSLKYLYDSSNPGGRGGPNLGPNLQNKVTRLPADVIDLADEVTSTGRLIFNRDPGKTPKWVKDNPTKRKKARQYYKDNPSVWRQ